MMNTKNLIMYIQSPTIWLGVVSKSIFLSTRYIRSFEHRTNKERAQKMNNFQKWKLIRLNFILTPQKANTKSDSNKLFAIS